MQRAACGRQHKQWWRGHGTVTRVLLLLVVGSVSTLLYLQPFTIATYLRVFFPLFGLYGLAVGSVFWQRPGSPSCLGLLVGFAVVFRLLVLFSPLVLSSDLYRYVWDGRVQRAGINPYRYPPAAEALAALRDTAIHPQINRPELTTIYGHASPGIPAVLHPAFSPACATALAQPTARARHSYARGAALMSQAGSTTMVIVCLVPASAWYS